MKKSILVLMACAMLTGCSSVCKLKPTIMEQKQCQWEQRKNRGENMCALGGLMTIIAMPNIAYFVLSDNRNIAHWVGPTFLTGWAFGMGGMLDAGHFIGPYPKEEKK